MFLSLFFCQLLVVSSTAVICTFSVVVVSSALRRLGSVTNLVDSLLESFDMGLYLGYFLYELVVQLRCLCCFLLSLGQQFEVLQIRFRQGLLIVLHL